MDKNGLPVKMKITAGTVNDSIEAAYLIEGIDFQKLLADKAFDVDAIIEAVISKGAEAVIPPKANRKIQRWYDKELYKKRHLVENVMMFLKRWRGIATRYAKNTIMFLGAVQICCFTLWLNRLKPKTRVNTL